jgi:hypothetical protein
MQHQYGDLPEQATNYDAIKGQERPLVELMMFLIDVKEIQDVLHNSHENKEADIHQDIIG